MLRVCDYHQIAIAEGMPQGMVFRFTAYMLKRWPEGVADDYAQEWANRFKKGTEFAYADNYGRKLLIETYAAQGE